MSRATCRCSKSLVVIFFPLNLSCSELSLDTRRLSCGLVHKKTWLLSRKTNVHNSLVYTLFFGWLFLSVGWFSLVKVTLERNSLYYVRYTHTHLFLKNCSADGNVTHSFAKAVVGFQLYNFMDTLLGRTEQDYQIQVQSKIERFAKLRGAQSWMFGFHPSPCSCAWPLTHSLRSSVPFGKGLHPTSDLLWQPKRQPRWGTGGEGAHITHRPPGQPVWSTLQGDREKEAAAGLQPESPKTLDFFSNTSSSLGVRRKEREEAGTKDQVAEGSGRS